LDEWSEVDSVEFQNFVKRFCTDEPFRREQLEAQNSLFKLTNQTPPWCYRGLGTFHKLVQLHMPTDVNIGQVIQIVLSELHHLKEAEYFADPNSIKVTEEDFNILSYLTNLNCSGQEIALLGCLAETPDETVTEWYVTRRLDFLRYDELGRLYPPPKPIDPETRKRADERAVQLIRDTLPSQEAQTLIEKGELKILSKDDACFYLVKRKADAKIEVYRDGKIIETLCLIFKQVLHDDDVVLSKIMMLKHQEEAVLEIANHFKQPQYN
jgi:hypothetical protein